jgi:hypothetical protein
LQSKRKSAGLINNRNAQAMVIDLILLVIISSTFFIFLSSISAEKSSDAAAISSQSKYTERLLLSILNYDNGNGTVAEMVGLDACATYLQPQINSTVFDAFSKLDSKDSYFILVYAPNKAIYNNISCVKTEQVSVSAFDMSLPCGNNTMITLGVWPKTQKVETC